MNTDKNILDLKKLNIELLIHHDAENNEMKKWFVRYDMFDTANSMSSILGISKEYYTKVMVNKFNAKVTKRELISVFFDNQKDAAVAKKWVESLMVAKRLRGKA